MVKNLLKSSFVWLILLAVVIAFSIGTPNFLTVNNLLTICKQVSMLGLVALGLSFILITGKMDLSMGTTLSFGIVFYALAVSTKNWNLPPVVAMLLSLLMCAAVGWIKGFIVTFTKMPPMIATLGVSTTITGVEYLICGGYPVRGIPSNVLWICNGYVGIVPVPVIIAVVMFVLAAFVFNKTHFGRQFFYVGSNPEASRLSGISVARIQRMGYAIGSAFCGLAAIMLVARMNSSQVASGDGYQINALTACAVGGISLSGGEGRVPNIIAGSLIIGCLSNGMVLMNINTYWQDVIQGLVLIVAVSADYLQRNHTRVKKAPA